MSNEAPTDALRLVPVEPTEAMLDVGKNSILEARTYSANDRESARAIWAQMLSSAPASPLPGGGWQDISAHDGSLKPVLLIAPYPTGSTWSDIIHGWWQPAYVGGDGEIRPGRWARWRHDFPPTHFMQPGVPAAPTGEPK